jgi:hypothetical protein
MVTMGDVMALKFCASAQNESLASSLHDVTRAMNIHNVFNPSFYCDDDLRIFSFRAIPNGNDLLASFVSTEDGTGHRILTNLSIERYEELGGVRLIDPKVVNLNGDYYVTFNSGWNVEGNDIFIMKIFPSLGPPVKLIYGKRKKQERNWAFFSEGGEIYALYWINPLRILKLARSDERSWEMVDYFSGPRRSGMPINLTLGTQVFKSGHRHYFVAHHKLAFLRKKVYVGKLCSLDFEHRRVELGSRWLAHSPKSLLGSRIKHNSNLLSCTYFSGLQVVASTVHLGYGINDVDCGFSTHDLSDL